MSSAERNIFLSGRNAASIVGTLIIMTALAANARAQGANAEGAQTTRCFAITLPALEGMPGNATDVANGIRDLMAGYLQGPSIKVVVLEAKLMSQASEEAKAKGCEPMLVLKVTRKAGGGHGLASVLGRGASAASWRIPGGGSAASSMARAGVAGGVDAIGSAAQAMHARDEINLEYKLQGSDGAINFGPRSEHQKAAADGEDLLTPVVSRAAEALVSQFKSAK